MPTLIGNIVGAFLGALLISRLFTWLIWKLLGKKRSTTILSYVVICPVILILAAIGNADGGPLAWKAGLIYMPFCLLFLALDLRRIGTPEAKGSSSIG